MKKKLLIISVMGCLFLTGCGLEVTVNDKMSRPVITSLEDTTDNSQDSSTSIVNNKITESNNSIITENSVNVATENSNNITEYTMESSQTTIEVTEVEINSESAQEQVVDSKYKLTDLITFDTPDNYVLLDDENTTDISRMYALPVDGTIVSTLFIKYVEATEVADLLEAHKIQVAKIYELDCTASAKMNDLDWSILTGVREDEKMKQFGCVCICPVETGVIYFEFMSTEKYDYASDVSNVLKSIKLKSEGEEK